MPIVKKMYIEFRFKENLCRFPETLPFKKVQWIIESYPNKLPDKAKWWYRKTDFGIYFLNKIKKSASSIKEIDGKDWKIFRPILKNFFPTLTERKRALANSQFLIGNLEKPSEDYYFVKYILLDKFGKLTNEELEDMNYKDVIMMYKYTVDPLIRRNMILNIAQENVNKQKENQEEKQSGMTV